MFCHRHFLTFLTRQQHILCSSDVAGCSNNYSHPNLKIQSLIRSGCLPAWCILYPVALLFFGLSISPTLRTVHMLCLLILRECIHSVTTPQYDCSLRNWNFGCGSLKPRLTDSWIHVRAPTTLIRTGFSDRYFVFPITSNDRANPGHRSRRSDMHRGPYILKRGFDFQADLCVRCILR